MPARFSLLVEPKSASPGASLWLCIAAPLTLRCLLHPRQPRGIAGFCTSALTIKGKSMFKRAFILLSVSTLFLMTFGCGGGGGGSSPPPPPPPTGNLPITSANAQDITESVLEAVSSVIELIAVTDVVGLPGIPEANANQVLLISSRSPFSKLSRVDNQLQAPVTGTVPCDSGQVTVTWDDADNDMQVSTGDTFDILFEDCFFTEEEVTLNGATSLMNITVTGDPVNEIAPWSFVATFGFDNLEGTDATDTATIDGDLTLDLSSGDNVVIDLAVAITSLTVVQSGETATLSDFVLTESIDVNTLALTIDSSGTFTSTELNGSVTFETLVSFMIIGDDNPFAGQLLISDDSSSVLVTVIDNISVQLDIDEDLDGTIDDTIIVTWDDLDID